ARTCRMTQHGHSHGDHHHGHQDGRGQAAAGSADRVKDLVCGMTVDPKTSKHRHEHAGTVYHFCSTRCRERFAADPERYLKPAADAAPAPSVPAGTVFTCPMHPEIRQIGPGSCPICGMALEPVMAGPESGPNPELAS